MAGKKAQKKKERLPEIVDSIEIPRSIADDPRKALFLRLYFSRTSRTFGNAKQSAIQAGFSEEYADNITVLRPKWLSDFIGRQDFVSLAEDHLREVLMLPNIAQAMSAFGPVYEKVESFEWKTLRNGKMKKVKRVEKVPVLTPNPAIIKVKNEASKIILPAHDPDRYGSKKGGSGTFVFNLIAARQRYSGI